MNKESLAIRTAMSKKFTAIIGSRMPIRSLNDDEILDSYLSNEPAIYVKENPKPAVGLDKKHKTAYQFGLFAQEMLKYNFVNYEYLQTRKVAYDLKDGEFKVLTYFVNILEKIYIENAAATLFDGYLLKAYKYMLNEEYKNLPDINDPESSFAEFFNALEQFSIMGPIKGKFETAEAKSAFSRNIKKIHSLSKMTNSEERIDTIYEVFDDTSDIWRDIADNLEEGMSSLPSALSSIFNSSFANNSVSDLDPDEIANSADLSKGSMRNTTFRELSDEEKEEMEEEEEEIDIEDEDEEEDIDDEFKEELADYDGNDDAEIVFDNDEEFDLTTSHDYDPDEFEIEREGLDFFDRLIEAEISMANAKEKEESDKLPEFKTIDKKYSGRHYKLSNVSVNLKDTKIAKNSYNKVLLRNINSINATIKKLKKMFADDVEETEFRTSGKLSIDRTVSTTKTAKLFTKTVTPEDKTDMAVMVLIDESGSMSGSRIERAKEAAINITEIFGKIGIPTYIMGFTADMSGYDVIHYHYSDWNNKQEDRLKLTSIAAKANNFDGYSIRYASKLLGLRPETHKILFVISDGQPAAQAYNRDSGIRDTKDAIRESRSNGQTVIGVAIGSDIEELQAMYGKDFIFIEENKTLFAGMIKRFTEVVKSW